jgi:hypothetical protein
MFSDAALYEKAVGDVKAVAKQEIQFIAAFYEKALGSIKRTRSLAGTKGNRQKILR